MNIEKITTDKLRVNLSANDLDQYNLDYLSISSESPGTKRMLKDILIEAEETEGFSARGCRLLIEVLPGKCEGCVLYLTRMSLKETPQKGKSREGTAAESYILSCGKLDDAINAINCFAYYPDIPLVKSTLYNLGGKYHLTFSPVICGLDSTRLVSLLANLSEYGETSAATPLQEAMLAEHGNTIKAGRAVESFMRYFL